MRISSLVVLLAASAGCSASSSSAQTVGGRALLKGESDNSGIFVLVSGKSVAEDSRVTDASGAYSFSEVSNNRIFLTAYASSTQETVQEVFVDLGGGGATVPDFVFTPVGGLTGSVTFAGAAAEGTVVAVEGTDHEATCDGAGNFTIAALAVGSYTLRVTVVGHPFATVPDATVTYKQTTTLAPIAL